MGRQQDQALGLAAGQKPAIPEVSNPGWCQTPVDNFILAKLDENGLKPNPPADKRTLIRRATFDLIGLPPTPEEVQDFVNDPSPDAFAKVVDRLLASPHYGERWGRHWLDVARYSDTKGQPRRNTEDNANPVRVDLPRLRHPQFQRGQALQSFSSWNKSPPTGCTTTARNPTNLAALGFLTVGDHFMGMQNDIINDRIDVVTQRVSRPDRDVRALPRPQVRSDSAKGLLFAARDF